MKKLFTILFALTCLSVIPVMAQNTQKSKARLNYIRNAYKSAQENASRSADNMISVTQRDKDESGVWTKSQEFYYLVGIVEGPEIPYYKLNLLRSTSKGTDNKYEEFLYDPEEEDLIFYFVNFEIEKGVKCETRYYMGAADDGTGLQVTKYTDTKTGKDVTDKYKDYIGMPWDEGFLLRYAHDMQEAFNHLTLRGWD